MAPITILALALASVAGASQGQPSGGYCGSLLGGLVSMKVNAVDAGHMDIDLHVFGTELSCPSEPYALDAATGVITLTGIHKDSDCLKAGFAKRGQDPSSVSLVYNATADSINMAVMGVGVDLTSGACSKALTTWVAGPSGGYCGSLLGGLVSMKVKAVDAGHMDIDLSVFGTKLSCPSEPYTLDAATGVITLTGIHKDSDCLKVGFAKRGQDPSSVSLVYNATADSINMAVMGVGVDLTSGACSKALTTSVAGPAGGYCGSLIGGLVSMKVKAVDAGHMDIDLSVFGTKLSCPSEPYTLDAATGVITLTGIHKDSDCLKAGFAKRGQDPSSVSLIYNATANSIKMAVAGVGVDLVPGGCSVAGLAGGPSGRYCGTLLAGLVSMKVTAVDSGHLGIDLLVFGAGLSCPSEPYSLDAATGAITLTEIHKDSDCLKAGFAKRGQDPSTVTLTYNATANSIKMMVMGFGADLAQGSCPSNGMLILA